MKKKNIKNLFTALLVLTLILVVKTDILATSPEDASIDRGLFEVAKEFEANIEAEKNQTIQARRSSYRYEDIEKNEEKSLEIIRGIDKALTRTFTGKRLIIGKAKKDTNISLYLYTIDDQEAYLRSFENLKVGDSELYEFELEFDDVGNYYIYILAHDKEDIKSASYKFIVESEDVRDALENFKISFKE